MYIAKNAHGPTNKFNVECAEAAQIRVFQSIMISRWIVVGSSFMNSLAKSHTAKFPRPSSYYWVIRGS